MKLQEALQELDTEGFKSLSNEMKLQRLDEIVNSLSADTSGSKTVFYSGIMADGQKAEDIVNAMTDADPTLRVINKTDAGLFLNNQKFQEALAEAVEIDLVDFRNGKIPQDPLFRIQTNSQNCIKIYPQSVDISKINQQAMS
ncbi:MAG: hypothetical protein LBP54_07645 [Campylobacteraceae bacterium]|jgi:hypothetical protein|nr:hypothetical protein [Campylobacteraceae bacterium]